jgi:hypothetical protein
MQTKTLNNILVSFIIIISLIAAIYGFFSNEIVYENKTFQTIDGETVTLYGKGLYYKDSVSAASQARAQDIVTLFAGIPLLIVSLLLSNKNSIRGKLLLTGTIGYFLYTYTSYSFLTMYNKFFLLYVMLMSLSFFSFIINITSAELKELEKHFRQYFPRKYIGIITIIIGVLIGLLWLGRILPSLEKVPDGLEHYTTLVIQAMDLGFIVPVALLSGILLLKNKSLGYLLSSIIIIKGTTLLLAIVVMIIFMIFSGVNVSIVEMALFPIFAIFCAINLFIIFRNVG